MVTRAQFAIQDDAVRLLRRIEAHVHQSPDELRALALLEFAAQLTEIAERIAFHQGIGREQLHAIAKSAIAKPGVH